MRQGIRLKETTLCLRENCAGNISAIHFQYHNISPRQLQYVLNIIMTLLFRVNMHVPRWKMLTCHYQLSGEKIRIAGPFIELFLNKSTDIF